MRSFSYAGFRVLNPEDLPDEMILPYLSGLDYLTTSTPLPVRIRAFRSQLGLTSNHRITRNVVSPPKGVDPTSDYGALNRKEDFAESFVAYMTGIGLTPLCQRAYAAGVFSLWFARAPCDAGRGSIPQRDRRYYG